MVNSQLEKWQKELDSMTTSSRWGETRRFRARSDWRKVQRRDWLISHIADLKTRKTRKHQRPHRRHSKLGTTFKAGRGKSFHTGHGGLIVGQRDISPFRGHIKGLSDESWPLHPGDRVTVRKDIDPSLDPGRYRGISGYVVRKHEIYPNQYWVRMDARDIGAKTLSPGITTVWHIDDLIRYN
jgi:hypothetical protein